MELLINLKLRAERYWRLYQNCTCPQSRKNYRCLYDMTVDEYRRRKDWILVNQ